jgi:hypothetical protein
MNKKRFRVNIIDKRQSKISKIVYSFYLNINIIYCIFFLLLVFNPLKALANPQAVTTFHSVGLYWSHANGSASNECKVSYRKTTDEVWSNAMPLWFDVISSEYRGSIVNLIPNTEYEVELKLLSTGDTVTLISKTWSEDFPIAETVYLPENSQSTLTINQSGNEDGYVLFTNTVGKTATIDVKNNFDSCIIIGNVHHVIIRNVILKGASRDAIRINSISAHDIVIEESEFTEWGRYRTSDWGVSGDAGIGSITASGNSSICRIIIQRNNFHHPRYSTNSWIEPTVSSHPYGPWATRLPNTDGNHVIRYNSIYSDDNHLLEDGFSGWSNFSDKGFPNKDTDIYGNYIERCWDDAIESEGANMNVRIWGNFIKTRHHAIGTTVTATGPIYIFRNISKGFDTDHWGEYIRGGFLKQKSVENFPGGKTYVIHNTMLVPTYSGILLGNDVGLGAGWGGMPNTYSRNNILHVENNGRSINDIYENPLGDYDFDLYNGTFIIEKNGIIGTPSYDPTPSYSLSENYTGKGVFTLSKSSFGYDRGEIILNFNDNFVGDGPDIGAHERGYYPMEFGLTAYKDNQPNLFMSRPKNYTFKKKQ